MAYPLLSTPFRGTLNAGTRCDLRHLLNKETLQVKAASFDGNSQLREFRAKIALLLRNFPSIWPLRWKIVAIAMCDFWRVPNPPGANPLIAERAFPTSESDYWSRTGVARCAEERQESVGISNRLLAPCHTRLRRPPRGPFSYQGVSTRGGLGTRQDFGALSERPAWETQAEDHADTVLISEASLPGP